MEKVKFKFDATKIPINKSIDEILKERSDPIREFTKSVYRDYEALILFGLEKFGITPDGYPENLKERVRIRRDPEWNGNTDVYVDDLYAFSVIAVVDEFLEDYGLKFGWKLYIYDFMIGWKWSNEERWRPR